MRPGLRTTPIVALALTVGAAQASNIIANPDFDDGYAHWFASGSGPGIVVVDDRDGVPDPPSLHLSSNGSNDASATSLCTPIDDSANVDLHMFVKGLGDGGGFAWAGVDAYTDTDCAFGIVSLTTDNVRLGADGAWFPIGFDNTALPRGTQAVSVRFGVWAGASGAVGDALFDHVAFGPTGTLDDAIPVAEEGLTGAWYNPETSGQGFEFVIDPGAHGDDASLFGAWFTFEATPGGPDTQRWYSLQATLAPDATTADVTIYRNLGGLFDAPPPTSAVAVGSGSLMFFSCSTALFHYALDDVGLAGTIPLVNLLPNVECGAAGPPPASDFGLSGAWYDPATSGQGLVVEVNPVDAQVFVGWYTYSLDEGSDGAQQQRWLSAQGAYDVGSNEMELTIYQSSNGTFDSDDTAVTTTRVGVATLTFLTCTTATLDYAFDDGEEFAEHADSIDLVRLGPALASCPLDP